MVIDMPKLPKYKVAKNPKPGLKSIVNLGNPKALFIWMRKGNQTSQYPLKIRRKK